MPSHWVPVCSPSSWLLCWLCHLRVSAKSAALLLAESKACSLLRASAAGEVLPFWLSAHGCASWHPLLGAAPTEPASALASAPPQENGNGMAMHQLSSRGQSPFH